ncbi:MAG: CvpA family protein [Flavobacteriales bacterium]|nr:CvpA family protein [Flavobacteriales bacterium]MBK6944283.1 CvpA family protein [Flavobacteriales bacterium]MBK7240484.1 CvpA family protein [Flavobacteriales bacterium]MBK9533951.1 CvpA family protein [Flavobacteriales bacterium]MBP9139555.1 CvpA family protein [Flavobacteriales bacterium]
MNWVDWVIVVFLGYALVRGFFRGFFVELAGLVALVLGIWGAVMLNDKIAVLIGLDPSQEIISFLFTLVLIVLVVHIIGRVVTKLVDMVQLGFLNKLGGALLGIASKAFLLSLVLNLFAAKSATFIGPIPAIDDSGLFEKIRVIAPAMTPALERSKWMQA